MKIFVNNDIQLRMQMKHYQDSCSVGKIFHDKSFDFNSEMF